MKTTIPFLHYFSEKNLMICDVIDICYLEQFICIWNLYIPDYI